MIPSNWIEQVVLGFVGTAVFYFLVLICKNLPSAIKGTQNVFLLWKEKSKERLNFISSDTELINEARFRCVLYFLINIIAQLLTLSISIERVEKPLTRLGVGVLNIIVGVTMFLALIEIFVITYASKKRREAKEKTKVKPLE